MEKVFRKDMNPTMEIKQKLGIEIMQEILDNTGKYRMFNDGSPEIEVCELLYSLVRLIKPKHVLETGLYKGVSSSYMGLALRDNGGGYLDGLEIAQEHIKTTQEKWDTLGISQYCMAYHKSSLEFVPQVEYGFLFLDTEPQIRFSELVHFWPYLKEGGYAFIHDLHRGMSQGNINTDHPNFKSWPFGDIPPEIIKWVTDDKLRVFHLPTPRGLTGFYKVAKDDYDARIAGH